MSDPTPTDGDVERANSFFRLQAQMEAAGEDDEDDLVLAAEFARVRAEEREACANLCAKRADEWAERTDAGIKYFLRAYSVEAGDCAKAIRARGVS